MFSKPAFPLLLTIFLSLLLVNAHPGEIEPILTRHEEQLRQLATNKRHAVARNCDSAIAAYEAKRRAKRSATMQKKREEEAHHFYTPPSAHGPPPKTFAEASHKSSSSSSSKHSSTRSSSAASPSSSANSTTYTTLQNVRIFLFCARPHTHLPQTTCVLTPEAEEGPFYIVRTVTLSLFN